MELQTITLKRELVINSLHMVHYYELAKDFAGPRKAFDAWELVYIDRGELLVTSGSEEYPMASGELILHGPGDSHALRGNGTAAANVLTVIFPCRSPILESLRGRRLRPNTAQKALLKDVLKESRVSFSSRLDDPASNTLIREKDPPIGSEQMIGCYMTELLVSLLRQVHRPQNVDKKIGSQPMLDAIVTYMEQNLSNKLSLELLSEEFHVSPSYIKRLFTQYKQMGAIKFFTTMKIEQAKMLLRRREKNVSQIAEDLGYDNIYYFCNQFKNFTGMSPMEYRKSVNAIGNWATKYKR